MTKERVALDGVVRAWESLPEGHHRMSVVAEWVRGPMKTAIDAARAVLADDPTGGLLERVLSDNATNHRPAPREPA